MCGTIMFGFLKRKQPESPRQLVFKSNEAAFEYACMCLNTSLVNENLVLGIVLEMKSDRDCCLKLSNKSDPTVPKENLQQILNKGNYENICPHATALDAVPRISKGDLVMYVAPAELAALGQGNLAGVIVAKVQPIYDLEQSGWVTGS
jgi:hypothetical protein